jgi:4-hydroxy-2-oxoheptanedioate aldolase
MVACYCETLAAINKINEIAAVEGVDIIFIGPYDLSQALGVIGEPNHPKVLAAINTIITAVRSAGKVVGTIASDADQAAALIAKGIQYICLSSDLAMIAGTGKDFIKKLGRS